MRIDSECGKQESKHFIALVEGDWVSLCAIVCPHHITSGFQSHSMKVNADRNVNLISIRPV